MKSLHVFFCLLASLAIGAAGCDRHEHDHDHEHGGHHHHTAPHGGTLIMLGDHAAQIELVRDKATGTLDLYVLDGEAENFIRIAQPAVALTVTRGSQTTPVSLPAVAHAATGEKVGDTAHFSGQSEVLKDADTFEVTLQKIDLNGTVYESVSAPFPQGKH